MCWLCVTLSLCATKVTHWSGAVRERSRILVQFYGHAAANTLRQMQAAARKVKGVDVVTGAGWNRFRHGAALTRDLAQVPSRYSFSSLVPNVSIAR
ncbi:hypothetical protein E1818_19080 [Salmonella enterica subsp. enterica serovar Blukwa]|nr:hypothetical protein [Salmonella enterica subsp. enterica serovar Blukwa]